MWNQVNWHFKEGKDHQPISLKRTCFLKALRSTSLFGMGGPGGSVVKHPPANAGGSGSIPGWERSPRERNPLRYSRLEHSVDGEPGRLQSGGCKESDTASTHTHTHTDWNTQWGVGFPHAGKHGARHTRLLSYLSFLNLQNIIILNYF